MQVSQIYACGGNISDSCELVLSGILNGAKGFNTYFKLIQRPKGHWRDPTEAANWSQKKNQPIVAGIYNDNKKEKTIVI